MTKRTMTALVSDDQRSANRKEKTHHLLDSLPQLGFLLYHIVHFFEDGRRQLHIEVLGIGHHFAQKLLMGEDAVTVEAAVVGDTLTSQRQLGKQRGCKRFEWKQNLQEEFLFS